MNFHWYEECYLEALAEKGYDHAPKGVVKPWVYLAEIYWPGHGMEDDLFSVRSKPTIDLHIAAQHRDFITTVGGGVLTTVVCKYDHRHVMGLHPYRYELPMRGDENHCRFYAQEMAEVYGYAGEIYEFGTPEDMYTGEYGT